MRSVRTSDFKAHLSEHLREVRQGATLIVLDRDRPVARVVPWSDPGELVVTPGKGTLSEIRLLPPLDLGADILDLLAEERADR